MGIKNWYACTNSLLGLFSRIDSPIGNLISITEAAPNDELKIADEAARAYYENTVFEVVSLEFKSLIAQSLYN